MSQFIALFLLLSLGVYSQPSLQTNSSILIEDLPENSKKEPCIQYTYPPTAEWEPVDSENYYNSGLEDCRFEEIKFPFYRKDGEVFFSNEINDKERLEGVMPEKFIPLEGDYGRNDNEVYYGSQVLEEADAASFRSPFFDQYGRSWTNEDRSHFKMRLLNYGADDNFVYYEGRKIPHMHGASVELIPDINFPLMKDKNHVFLYDDLLPEINVTTFTLFDSTFDSQARLIDVFKDKNYLYYFQPNTVGSYDIDRFDLSGIDVKNLEFLIKDKSKPIFRDKNWNYYAGESEPVDGSYSIEHHELIKKKRR